MIYFETMKRQRFKSFLLVIIFYFFSGLPLGYFYTFLPVQLRAQGVELSTIGLISLAGLSWSLKPLWAPFMDRLLSRTLWMAIFALLLGVNFLILSLSTLEFSIFLIFLLFLTFFSSSFDTALDGWFIEAIPKGLQGQVNGLRISSYRVALIVSGGLATALSQFIYPNYIPALFGILFLALFPIPLKFASTTLAIKEEGKIGLSMFIDPFKDFLSRKSGLLTLLFVFSYKIGDALLGGMVYPFWVDRGFERAEIGLFAGTLGTILTIAGALIGGMITGQVGLKKALFSLGLLQAFSNLGYTVSALPNLPKETVYLASVIESFTGGLGTSAFITFLTSLCRKEVASSQYAILSMLFSLSTTLSRSLSGFLAEAFGYAGFFLLSFFIALIPLALIKHLGLNGYSEA
ncbi:MAG: MFS transporter [Thermodesulfobacterium sp.]|nr:MFS transporter [Thermodesulfobacterium sp.]